MSTPPVIPLHPVETAPSVVAPDEQTWSRPAGMMGVLLLVLGSAVVGMTELYGPRIVSKGWGFIGIALGIVLMLFHAVRDADIEIRRAYGVVGYGLLVLLFVLTIFKQSNFLTYGWACALVGLCFLLCFSKHESEIAWRQPILITIGAGGGVMALVGFFCGLIVDNFLPTYGVLLTVLGLIYLCAFIGQSDPKSEAGHRTALAIGVMAAFVFLYAAFRSAAPTLIGARLSPFLVPNGLLLMFLSAVYGATALSIASDNKLVVQTRRELTGYFYSPVAYLVMLAIAMLGWMAYWVFVTSLRGAVGGEPIVVYEPIVSHYFSMFPPVAVIFVIPAITMRLMAEERRTGTYEVLMCAPVKESTVVVSKFLACLVFFLLLWGIWALYLIGLRVEGEKEFDYRPLLSFYLALAVSGASFVAMGLFFSSLSKNQIVAAVLTFVGMLLIYFVGFLQDFDQVAPIWKSTFRHISYSDLWKSSLRGRLQVREMILQGSFAFFWLFLTVKVLEARRWS